MTTAARATKAKPAFKGRPIQKNSISDDIVQQIMKQISSGNLRPGDRLPSERELCKSFNAGRSSLREALRCLSIMGVLTARVGEGTSVSTNGSRFLETVMQWRFITEKYDIRNLMETRISLEGLAAASSAERATDEEIAGLETLLEKMEGFADDPRRYGAVDLEFHLGIAKASQNQVIYDMVSLIRGQLARALSEILGGPDARPRSTEEHRIIIGNIKKRSPEAARKAMQAHLEAAILRYEDAQASS